MLLSKKTTSKMSHTEYYGLFLFRNHQIALHDFQIKLSKGRVDKHFVLFYFILV